MKSTSSDPEPTARVFCAEPWTGVLSVEVDNDVVFCPCFLKLKIGNLNESSLAEVWNAPPLVLMRRAFRDGVLPEVCQGQLCPPVLGEECGPA